ncbi:MAG: DUF3611 family protein [Cyanobacteria bacterium P01_A01_bin.114]
MTGELGYSLPPAVRRIANAFRLVGWISFWSQAVLAVISSMVLIFASATLGARAANAGGGNPGTGAGLGLAVLGLLTIYIGAYWAWSYTRLGRKLRTSNPDLRPKPKDAAQKIRIGIIISLVGMLLTLLGTQAIVGSLLGKSVSSQAAGFINPSVLSQFIQPVDIFVVQAATNILLAHFIGMCASLWLSRAVNRQ